jgi:hypothetical protein
MDDEGLAVLKDTEFGKNLIAWAESLPATILEISKDPLQIGVFNTIILSVAMLSKWIIPIFSMEFIASFFAVLEQFPWVLARFPLTLRPILIATLEGIPVFIESMIPILLTSLLGAVGGLTEFVPAILALDPETIASVFTTPVNTLMEILSIMGENAFHWMGGGLLWLQNGVSLLVSCPRVAVAFVISLVLTLPVLIPDIIFTFLTYLPGIIPTLILSFIIALIVTLIANDLVVLFFSTIETVVDPQKYIIDPILRVLDLFDVESLRNLVGVFSEGAANLL